jgi:hypothetical protein
LQSNVNEVVMQKTAIWFCAGCLLGYIQAGPAAGDERLAAIKRLGEINGVALNCGAFDETRRMKQALVMSLPKQRQLGELFDYETNRSFNAFIQAEDRCPASSVLGQRVDQAIRALEAVYADR